MDIYLDSTEYKRIDLCLEFNAATYENKVRRFVVKWGSKQRSFEDLLEAVTFYRAIDIYECEQGATEDLK